VPKNPVTKPMDVYAKKYESTFDFEDIIYQLVRNPYTLEIKETMINFRFIILWSYPK
jgi:hypothetical protein